MTDTGLARLAGLRHLERLELRDTKITDAGLRDLRAMKLTYLGLPRSKVTDRGLRKSPEYRALPTSTWRARKSPTRAWRSLRSFLT